MAFRKLLVTGGAGFIGSNFIHHMLGTRPGLSIINLDKLTYAGNLNNLNGVYEKYPTRYIFVNGDINDGKLVASLMGEVDAIVHFAAESHVDRSILDAGAFVETNVKGTLTLLNVALNAKLKKFVHVSTDEVYGSLGEKDPAFTESTPIQPNSPYSASKAGSDMLVRAFHHTHGLNTVTTRCSNNYGYYQFPEKLIPLMITNAMEGKPLPVYAKGENVRDWIFVTDHCEGVARALENGVSGEVYNFGGGCERRNIDVVKTVVKILKKPESLIRFVEDRKGHDWRYAIDYQKATKELNWKPSISFEEGLKLTVKWYVDNGAWLDDLKRKERVK